MQNENIIESLDNEWQLIAYLTQKNQQSAPEEKADTDKQSEVEHVHEIAHENEEHISTLASAMQDIQAQIEELNEKVSSSEKTGESDSNLENSGTIKCKICGSTYENGQGMASHLRYEHDKTGEGIVQKYSEQLDKGVESAELDIQTGSDELYNCFVSGCEEKFDRSHYRTMHLYKHSPNTTAEIIKRRDDGDEIYQHIKGSARPEYIKKVDNLLDEENIDHKDYKQDNKEQSEQEEYTCPECGNTYSSIQGISNHATQQSDHRNPSDIFEEEGKLCCKYCDYTTENIDVFSNHLRNEHGTGIVREYLKIEEDDQNNEGGMFDEEGNAIALKDQRQREKISDYTRDQLEEKFYNYLQKQEVARTQHSITDALFDREYDYGTSKYSKVYDALNQSDRIYSTNNVGRRNRYYTEEAMLDQVKRDNIREKVENEVGEENWKLFVRAMKSLLPEKGDSTTISYYDFSGEYMGDEDYPSERMWRLFALPHNTLIRNALSEVASSNIDFEIKEPQGVPKGSSKYRDLKTVKGYKVEVNHR